MTGVLCKTPRGQVDVTGKPHFWEADRRKSSSNYWPQKAVGFTDQVPEHFHNTECMTGPRPIGLYSVVEDSNDGIVGMVSTEGAIPDEPSCLSSSYKTYVSKMGVVTGGRFFRWGRLWLAR